MTHLSHTFVTFTCFLGGSDLLHAGPNFLGNCIIYGYLIWITNHKFHLKMLHKTYWVPLCLPRKIMFLFKKWPWQWSSWHWSSWHNISYTLSVPYNTSEQLWQSVFGPEVASFHKSQPLNHILCHMLIVLCAMLACVICICGRFALPYYPN